jgi:methyltransferase-like protein
MEYVTWHGLQYLTEAEFVEIHTAIPPLEVVEVPHQIADSIIAQEQCQDFFRCHRFRQKLLCHVEHQPDHMPRLNRMADFYIALIASPDTAVLDL